jgi:hypothetical protein
MRQCQVLWPPQLASAARMPQIESFERNRFKLNRLRLWVFAEA